MRDWKNRFAPLFTCLMVLALALLPLRLSLLRDESLTGTVHAEELAADSNFPARPPELPMRLQLLARQLEGAPDAVTIISQTLEGEALNRAARQAGGELEELVRAGVLPGEVTAYGGTLSGRRVYLRDQTDLSSAGFLELNACNGRTGEHLNLCLDGETGRLVALEMDIRLVSKSGLNPAALGETLLDRLGLAYTRIPNDFASAAGFRLSDSRTLYWVIRDWNTLRLTPQVDWEAATVSTPANSGAAASK